MPDVIETDICVIGAGSGGLATAAGAAMMGASTVLVEKGLMGGDCLNYGCVPSKALLAAGKAAHSFRAAAKFGIGATEPDVDHAAVYEHVHGVIAAIEPNDSVARFEGLGVNVIQGEARFVGPKEIEVGDKRIKARRFVIATGSTASVPPIPGLDSVPFQTNGTIFHDRKFPKHLIIIGGGPIGCELAQAHRRLGADVTVLEMFSIMPKDDPELVDIARQSMITDGVDIREGVQIDRVEKSTRGVVVVLKTDDGETRIKGSNLLLATGRRPNVSSLNLEAAGVDYAPAGITVDKRLRTSNKHIFAIGDCAGALQFTHVALYHAGIVIRNALFRLPARVNYKAIPWVTYTSPEVAQVGLNEEQARAKYDGNFQVLRWPFHENDRAQAEHSTDGLVKIIITPNGKILGAGIAGPGAGELIQVWVLAIANGLKIGAMAGMVVPYPTIGEVSKRVAGSYYTPKLFGERTKWIVRFLAKFG
ncbi:MAG: FAD-dependent oxidoreductase [Rhodospirillales bacterium]|jgi:pyruvate/2-oxoglutarate dehydrogenase complex dihydrolipoamide dehydrogenase (E3) component|nr:FAD-dependent oxidoreductase [Rhodospirillales bacterium]MBT5352505.1 FAD-dependent oxidoreductase [Rhodospirillales bacterium]MBT5519485.1 FAD-dependent oxidoreductase [Rhodospirillales bacterium]MBT6111196.1 FAD-dependent oxidoreductase [Rhodospirillales bacterium]MBT7146104.1 FAD-dependent oxidoreductase [Rhodospirillales bacterium]